MTHAMNQINGKPLFGLIWHDRKAIYAQLVDNTLLRFPKTEKGYRDALTILGPCQVMRRSDEIDIVDMVAADMLRKHMASK